MRSARKARVRIERVADLADLRGDWDRLAEATGHPFATLEWVISWWQWFGADRPLYTFVCRDLGGEIVAILPMYLALKRPVRVARFLGYGDLHSPICAPEHRALAAQAINQLTTVRRDDGCHVVLAERLPGEQGWDEMLGGTLIRRDAEPYLRIDGMTWEEFLASRSQNFRREVGRQERRLERDFELSYRMADDPDRLDDDMTSLFRLHSARFGDSSTGIFEGERGRMHRELAGLALDRGWMRLWLLELDGNAVAANYSWRFAGSDWCLQQGRDPRFSKQKVGGTLLAHVVRESFRDGMDSFQFLAGDESYKDRWTDGDDQAETWLVGGPMLRRLGVVAYRLANAMPASMRDRMVSVSG